jgi:hypothetical protein
MTKRDFISLNQSALNEAMELIGECFLYNGNSYTGAIDHVEFQEDLMSGGIFQKLGAVIVVSKTEIPAKPVIGETLNIDGVTMRIEKVKADETSYELTCISAAA